MQEFEVVEEEDGTCCPEGRVTLGLGLACGDTSVGLAIVITCTGKNYTSNRCKYTLCCIGKIMHLNNILEYFLLFFWFYTKKGFKKHN